MIENFLSLIPDNKKEYIIFDIGARDCIQSIEFYNNFPNSKIYSFECNPNTLNICKKNIENYKDRIILIEGAVCDYDGDIKFYPINQLKTITSWKDGNPGASSLFISNGTYEYEKYIQDEIITKCHRLDTIMTINNIENVDIIWIDLQGAELLAFKGLGEQIKNVKYIHVEVSYKELYTGQVLFDELNNYLILNNFSIINKPSFQGWQEDIIYKKNSDLLQFEKKIFSQNNEDGITLEIIKRIINEKDGFYVEFGTQNGLECNTRILRELYNWNGLLMDGTFENKQINLNKEYITRENIIDLLQKYNVPKHFNLLSIDIDKNDFYVLHQILINYDIDIIILEYNATFLPHEDAIILYESNSMWDGTNYFGASLLSYTKLLNKYNYSLIYTEKKGVNAFFVKNKYKNNFNIINDISLLYNTPKYGTGPNGGHNRDLLNRKYVKYNDIVEVFDIVIVVGKKDNNIIKNQLEYTKKNIIGYRNIFLISDDDNLLIDNCITISEKIFPFSLETIALYHGLSERNGWYLQQLLKLYAGNIIPNILDKYLILDSDTFFIKPTSFFINNKPLYNYGNEYHYPYFEHMIKLNNNLIKQYPDKSGICHHMIFEKKIINELFNLIETTHNENFYKVFLKFVNKNNINNSGASEYEIYFNYIIKEHSNDIIIRKLNWINGELNNETLKSDYDYISNHWYLRK